MRKSIIYILLWILGLSRFCSSSVLKEFFPDYNYHRPSWFQFYPDYYNRGYSQPQPERPAKSARSYKDICRLVNTNGFTNPGGVPRCPY
uniref:Uncharacterized protein n=1 Tax=Drosophila melanogaster TaxID=7227 RepID=A0A1Z1CSL7_DROME|nr:uncharacterized protein Dmel_CG46303 [Drosophila melanogaster]API64929.1 uncharacterized protein Dmel_CG46303 [Drosophila melanogaster]|eukprot:NP_001334689.1 uncharacterized protein Dmel_CG46303 [Drosophila melanogaster]